MTLEKLQNLISLLLKPLGSGSTEDTNALLGTLFLNCCVRTQTPKGARIVSKLRCGDWEEAENILKAGNRLIYWGRAEDTKKLGKIVFKNGFPINEVISPVYSTLVDLQKIRNYIAHDGSRARRAFSKVSEKYMPMGTPIPDSAGELLLSRKKIRGSQVIRQIFNKVAGLSKIYSEL